MEIANESLDDTNSSSKTSEEINESENEEELEKNELVESLTPENSFETQKQEKKNESEEEELDITKQNSNLNDTSTDEIISNNDINETPPEITINNNQNETNQQIKKGNNENQNEIEMIEIIEEENEEKQENIQENTQENQVREKFQSKYYFLLVCVGFAVGLGNVLRFPYLMYRNGGGAFFIPYLSMVLFIGFPLVVFELGLGQTYLQGPVKLFQQVIPSNSKRFGGVGLASIIALSLVSMYYAVLLGWSTVFLFHSFHFSEDLPWKGNENYFFDEILNQSENIEHLGGMNWPIFFSVSICMIFVFFALVKGIEGSSKVAIVTVILPYIMLIILSIRGITLPGAFIGIRYYITPDWSKLFNSSIWIDAAVQVMFSLSPAWGVLITFGSYLDSKESVIKLSLILTCINSSTSIFAGFTVFSILGYLSYINNIPISDVVSSGPTLAYVVFPIAIAEMPLAWVFAISFFIMMLLLGIDSLFASVEAIIGAVQDSDFIKSKNFAKYWIVLFVVFFVWCGSLIFCTNGGSYLLYAADVFVPLLSFFIVAFFQLIAVVYFHGFDNFLEDYKVKSNYANSIPFPKVWLVLWKYFCPLVIFLLILIALWNEYTKPTLELPLWASILGWTAAFTPTVVIIWFFIFPGGVPSCSDNIMLWNTILRKTNGTETETTSDTEISEPESNKE